MNLLRQAWVLTRRYVSVWRGDPTALLTMLGQSLLVAVLMLMVFGRLADVADPRERVGRTVNLLFLVAVSCYWLGCNNAAKELVKERVIYTRERDFNLRADSYYTSKLVVLLGIGFGQVVLLFGVVRLWCGPPGHPLAQFGIVLLLTLAGTALGLLVSVVARTEEVAIALVPVAVIPQIILAGVIAPLTGGPLWLAKTAISTYGGAPRPASPAAGGRRPGPPPRPRRAGPSDPADGGARGPVRGRDAVVPSAAAAGQQVGGEPDYRTSELLFGGHRGCAAGSTATRRAEPLGAGDVTCPKDGSTLGR